MRAVASLFVAALLLMPSAAWANHLPVKDGASEAGPLDIQRVDNFSGARPRWRIKTYSRWDRQKIWDQGYLAVYLDTFGSNRHDYLALIWADADKIRGTLIRDRSGRSDYKVANLQVYRPGQKVVNVWVPFGKLRIGDSRATYNWYVQSTWSSNSCSNVCFDWAPDEAQTTRGVDEPL